MPAPEDRASAELWMAIGPEGGFSESEFQALKRGGFKALSLGEGVLRVETAVAASLAVAQLLANAVESSIDRNRSGQGR